LPEKVPHTSICVLLLVVLVASWGMAETNGHSSQVHLYYWFLGSFYWTEHLVGQRTCICCTQNWHISIALLFHCHYPCQKLRLFSYLKLTKSDWRAILGNKRLNQLLNIKLNMEEDMWESIKYEAEVKLAKLIQRRLRSHTLVPVASLK